MVGQPLTELFRLESISENQKINYFVDFKHRPNLNWINEVNSKSLFWELEHIKDVPSDLKGINFKFYQTNKYTWPSLISFLL